MREYKSLSLSDFQIEAFNAIDENKSVIVSTHTGNGKTLIADYAIEKCFEQNKRVIYTAPIKALSNQKYRQFKKVYKKDVGLITGDRTINPQATILVMTTEVLRNMLHEDPEKTKDIGYVVLDEIHYISNEERGTVWEEIIIFKPKETKIVGLSATIPNIGELCDWIEKIHNEAVVKIVYPERIVKQKHYYFDKHKKKASSEDIMKQYLYMMEIKGKISYRNSHIDFMKYAQKEKLLPVLTFVFSRKQCEEKAYELMEDLEFLSIEEAEAIDIMIAEFENKYPTITYTSSWEDLKPVVKKGIGYHHAGLLPIVKLFMEELFEKKLCKVLYATETFAVGINFPVRTVCFDSVRKYDGKSFRELYGSEYLQMAGRAGRRGIDKFGYVFVLADYKYIDLNGVYPIERIKSEEIKSQFGLSYNSIINMRARYNDRDINCFLRDSFCNYQYLTSLDTAKEQLKATREGLIGSENDFVMAGKCKITDIDACYLNHKKNSDKLKMLQIIKGKMSEKDQLLIERQIEELKKKLLVKTIKCSKQQRKECAKRIKEIEKDQKLVKKKEKTLIKAEENRPELSLKKDFDKKVLILKDLGYIDQENRFNPRGEVCSRIHVQEILITEMIFEGLFDSYPEEMIVGMIAGLALDNDSIKNNIPIEYDLKEIFEIIETINKKEIQYGILPSYRFNPYACGIMDLWCREEEISNITSRGYISEGDFVSLCRKVIDLLKQIKNAQRDNKELEKKLKRCIIKIDRDIVKLGL